MIAAADYYCKVHREHGEEIAERWLDNLNLFDGSKGAIFDYFREPILKMILNETIKSNSNNERSI